MGCQSKWGSELVWRRGQACASESCTPGHSGAGHPQSPLARYGRNSAGRRVGRPPWAGSHPGLGHVLAASPRAAAGTKGRVAARPPRQPLAAPPCDARGGGAPHPAGSCGRVPLPCATACASPAGPLEVSSSWVRDTRVQIRPGTREAERGELRSRGAKGHGARGRRPRPPSALPPRRSLLGAICFRLLCGELLASLSPE